MGISSPDRSSLSHIAMRVASINIESAKKKKPPKKKSREVRSKIRKQAEPAVDTLKSETEYSCRIELNITANFEGHVDKSHILKKLKSELIAAIKSGVTTTSRELNIASTGVTVQPIRLECDVNDLPSFDID
jgi:hypothetical protein